MEQDFRATQFVGSQAEAEVLLEQPRAEILLKQSRRRGRRQENEYLIGFEGYPDSDSYWVKEQTVRRDPNGPQLIAEYEAAIEQEEAAFDGQANSSDEDMTSVDIQGNVGEQRPAVRPALDIANQISTQQPSEPQLPQTQPPSQAGPSYAAEDWGFDDADEPSQEDLAAADWAAQHAAPQRPANAMVPARQSHPVGPQQIGFLAADPFERQSPGAAAQAIWPSVQRSALAKRPAADHRGLFNALGRRAAEMIRQAPPAPEGAEGVPAEGHPQMEHVQRETWRAWATRLQVLGGTVAAYAAAQDLPAEVAARAGAQGAPLVDLNALPAVRAQPEEAEEPIEEFIDVPSLPAAEEGTRKRDAVEPQRGRRPLKRLKRIYQSEAGEEDPAPEVESPELVPDSSEEAGKQEPAARQAHQGGGQATPLRPGRHLHILEDGEDAEEEANEAAEPKDNGQLDEEAPMHQVDEADSNDYGLNPEQLWHLQPEHWRGAVINRARHEADDVLLLRIRWPDGFNSWVNRFALHVRPHCHMALIDFYESKAKPKK
ncbi:hypothetical protein WJX75_005771 [Coccomyxa subellipsoidea]|uniref:Chromo domain-containing protein n=1 Tax=Coccomyxa subellipsoidea TaxID=248742 RepID=A0ABR2YJP3_9CHLO